MNGRADLVVARGAGGVWGGAGAEGFQLTKAWKKRKESSVNKVPSVYLGRSFRTLSVALVLALTAAVGPALAQGTGEFLCSAGTRDGQSCQAFSDCPGGVCVIAQGVCGDGSFCDCPGGTCTNGELCSVNSSFGTCVGGVGENTELCCNVSSNCPSGQSCTGTSKVCLNGQDKGLPCVNSSQCANGTCGSTGAYCDGGDFDFYPCVDNADCPGGTCDTSFVNQPTNTPGRTNTPTQPVRTNTPSGPTATVPPRLTPTPGTPAPTIAAPTATRTQPAGNTATPVPPTATSTPDVGVGATTVGAAAAGANRLDLAIDPASGFPVQGHVRVCNTLVPFTRRRSSTELDLRAEFGLPCAVAAGTEVRVIEYTPTPGRWGEEETIVEEGDGCAVSTRGSASPAWILLVGLAALRRLRRRG